MFGMQNIESELKWQTCSGTVPSKFSCSSGKGLNLPKGLEHNLIYNAAFVWNSAEG